MAESGRTASGVAKRIVISTTVAPKTHQFFADHPQYIVGRALDVWVEDQLAKDVDEKLKAFDLMAQALQVGGCSCGRLLRVRETKGGPAGVCYGCNQTPIACGCRPTSELAQRQLIDWQKIRAEAGLETTHEDFAAKKLELGLTRAHEEVLELRRKEREVSARRSAEALEAGASWHDGPAIVRKREP